MLLKIDELKCNKTKIIYLLFIILENNKIIEQNNNIKITDQVSNFSKSFYQKSERKHLFLYDGYNIQSH
jgi:hypothetical protein